MASAIQWCDDHTSELSSRYKTVKAEAVHAWLIDLLPPPPALVLDVGAGKLSSWLPRPRRKPCGASHTYVPEGHHEEQIVTATRGMSRIELVKSGMSVGILVFGHFADRVRRRPALFTFQAGAFIMVLVYSQLISPSAPLVGGTVMGLFVNGKLGGPTEARATAENGARPFGSQSAESRFSLTAPGSIIRAKRKLPLGSNQR